MGVNTWVETPGARLRLSTSEDRRNPRSLSTLCPHSSFKWGPGLGFRVQVWGLGLTHIHVYIYIYICNVDVYEVPRDLMLIK